MYNNYILKEGNNSNWQVNKMIATAFRKYVKILMPRKKAGKKCISSSIEIIITALKLPKRPTNS